MESESKVIQPEVEQNSNEDSSFRGDSSDSESQSTSAQIKKKSTKPTAGKTTKDKKAKETAKVKEVKKKKAATADFMTPERCEKMKAILMKIKNLNNVQLKEALRKNGQSMSGNKTELLAKVAEGQMFGRTPKCPTCFGGRPRLDLATGVYHCGGYYEDQNFFQCDATFEFGQMNRLPWIE